MTKSLKITRDKKVPNTVEIEVLNESHTLGNLLTERLLMDERCSFAAYKVPHPLEEKVLIKASAKKGADVINLISETVKGIVEHIDDVKKAIIDIEGRSENLG